MSIAQTRFERVIGSLLVVLHDVCPFNIDLEEKLNVGGGATKEPRFLAVNPKGNVPIQHTTGRHRRCRWPPLYSKECNYEISGEVYRSREHDAPFSRTPARQLTPSRFLDNTGTSSAASWSIVWWRDAIPVVACRSAGHGTSFGGMGGKLCGWRNYSSLPSSKGRIVRQHGRHAVTMVLSLEPLAGAA
jgi:hypothetical protein